MENKLSNINKSDELIANLRKSKSVGRDVAYPYAFGMAWAHLTEKQRQTILDTAERMAKESESN